MPGKWHLFGLALAVLPALPLACGSDVPDRKTDETPTCGNGVCESTQCETPLRCPADCGTCVDAQCNLLGGGEKGKCGEPCASSCDCGQPGEVCSADFDSAASAGTCLPVGCRNCDATTCKYTPDALGRCEAATCE